ncbi:extracellular solute-binding protein [Salinithrix halophila]|uniref:Extracellular solute-binding protein n=1 Tax=Salinithrix halophila TaxID=1485204 RepID=A0ABV8JG67_9BACL
MKKMRKAIAWIVSGGLVFVLMSCSADGTGQTDDQEKTYTITSLDFLYDDIPPKDGKGVKMIEEKFHVKYKRTYGVYTDYTEKVATQVASGDIPDVIGFEMSNDRSNFFKWAEQGAFLPLNDYIDEYPTLKKVPKEVWNAVSIDGKIMAIPKYFPPKYLNTPIIRKDWLDRLGLEIPKSHEELKEVALAFTEQDPDGNGKDDTYGMVLGENLWPNYHFGAYWDMGAWYHTNAKGQVVPGIITEERKGMIRLYADLYKKGAVNSDFVLTNPNEANGKEFYAGKAGMIVRGPVEMTEENMEALSRIHPGAELAPIPPFVAPDGSKGYTAGSGYYTATALSAKLSDHPGKVRRILEIIDYGRTFYPLDKRNPQNKEFDWLYGKEGEGYEMVQGYPVLSQGVKGLSPWHYLIDNKMWAPTDESNQYAKTYKHKAYRQLAEDLETMHTETKHYINPIYQVYSPTQARKGLELQKKLLNEQARMVTGDRPLSDWDQTVNQWLKAGGKEIIDEVNREMKKKHIRPKWQ